MRGACLRSDCHPSLFLNTTLHPNHPLKICGVKAKHHRFWKICGVWVKHHRFSQTWFELYFVIVFVHLCLLFCLFVYPFAFSPYFARFAARCTMEPLPLIENDYDNFGCNTSLWPWGICIWTCLHKYTMQIYKYTDTNSVRHSDAVSVQSCPKTNRKSKSKKYSICDLHSRSKRNRWKDVVVLIANTLLRRVEFGIWLSNTTEKFEISLGFASSDFKFHSPQKCVCD